MKAFVLDLETVRNGLAWAPKTDRPDTLAPAPCWDILCIGGLLLNDGSATLKIVQGATPGEAVCTVARIAEKVPLVTFNGRGFDMPVMESTVIREGLPAPRLFRKAVRGRFDDGHVDLCDYLSNHGATWPVSLDLWCRSIGLPGKGPVSGGDVAALVAAGRIAEAHAYCLSDVAQTAVLYLATCHAAADYPAEELHEAERAVWRAVKATPGLEWLLDCERAKTKGV